MNDQIDNNYLKRLETNILMLDNITNVHDLIIKCDEINRELDLYQQYLNIIESNINSNVDPNINPNINSNNNGEMDMETFHKNINQINKNYEIFDKLDLNQQIRLYDETKIMINSCNNFIENSVFQINYLDK